MVKWYIYMLLWAPKLTTGDDQAYEASVNI